MGFGCWREVEKEGFIFNALQKFEQSSNMTKKTSKNNCIITENLTSECQSGTIDCYVQHAVSVYVFYCEHKTVNKPECLYNRIRNHKK